MSQQSQPKTDLTDGLRAHRVWTVLAWQEIKQRYRRSVIGPFWITLSTAIMIGALSLVYATLFGQSLAGYLPFVAVGIVVWGFISTIISEATTVFVASEGFIKETRLPITVYACRLVYRNLIILAHNAVILALVALFFVRNASWSYLTLPVAILLIFLTGVFITIIVGTISARYRDVSQIIISLTQILFFVTPIMWEADALKNREWIAWINPVYHFIEIMRQPILAKPAPLFSWGVSVGICIILFIVAQKLLQRFKHRVAYWL